MAGDAEDVFRAAMTESDAGPETVETAPQQPEQREPAQPSAQAEAGATRTAEQPQQTRQEPETTRVPLAELLAEREKRQRFESQVAQMQAHFAQMQAQREQQPAPDFFADPETYIRQQLTPVESRFQDMQANMHQMMMHNARMSAAAILGADKVKAAEAAFNEAVQNQTIDAVIAQRINGSANPFESAVTWHQQQIVLKEVGSDPAAYKQRLLDDAMKDPTFIARVIEAQRLQATGSQPGRPRTVTLPSANRASAAPGADDDGPDDAVDAFRAAMRGR